jgi:hypothetical protein
MVLDCPTDDNDCKLVYALYDGINDDLEKQNAKLNSELQNLKAMHSTDYQKSNYKNTNMDDYKYYNGILFGCYYFLVLIIAYLTFKMEANRAIKALIMIVFIAYPFTINNIEILLYELFLYIYALASGTVYMKPNL